MSAAQHAERILQAWHIGDPHRLGIELEQAWACCRARKPVSQLEYEYQQLLEGVLGHLRLLAHNGSLCPPPRLEADLAVLRHLQTRAAAQRRETARAADAACGRSS